MAVQYDGQLAPLKLSKDVIKDEEQVHREVFIESPILPLNFFKNEQAILPRSQLIEEYIFVFVNGDVVELNDECFDMLITKCVIWEFVEMPGSAS